MILITKDEMRELEEVRKSIHKYIGGDVHKFWAFESLTGKLFRITHRRRGFKYILKNVLRDMKKIRLKGLPKIQIPKAPMMKIPKN